MKLTSSIVAVIVLVAAPYFIFKSLLSKPIYQMELDMGKIEKEIINIQVAYEKQEDITQLQSNVVCPANQLAQDTIKRIVIHHTVVSNDDVNIVYEAISRSHQKRWERWQTAYPDMPSDMMEKVATPSGKYTMYHRLIWVDGNIAGDRLDTQVWRWAWRKDNCNNVGSYHIAMVWNFQNQQPTDEQYRTLNDIIKWLREKYGDLPIYWHWQLEGEATACPGKMFDYGKIFAYEKPKPIAKIAKMEYKKPISWQFTFSLTRYYSPTKNQTKYLAFEINTLAKQLWRQPTLKELYDASVKRQFDWDTDNTMPAYWARYTNVDAGLVAACPKEWKRWTKFRVEWYSHTITCRDVWSAITEWRLDIYAGIWNYAIENWDSFPTWVKNITIIY